MLTKENMNEHDDAFTSNDHFTCDLCSDTHNVGDVTSHDIFGEHIVCGGCLLKFNFCGYCMEFVDSKKGCVDCGDNSNLIDLKNLED
jgi:hypothetical protein